MAGIFHCLAPRHESPIEPKIHRSNPETAGKKGQTFSPLFRNTVNPTIIRGGKQINVVPGEVSVDLDGRILPTFTPEALFSELTAMAGVDSGAAFEVLNHDAGPEKPDLSLFETLEAVLKEVDPDGLPVPMLMPAATDGRLFARVGIQTYGFFAHATASKPGICRCDSWPK